MTPSTPRTFTGPAEFAAAVRAAVEWSMHERELGFVDVDFAAWPLGDAAFLQSLTQWARQPQRRLTLLACGFNEVPRRHPAFVAWRRTWSHVMACREAAEIAASEMPGLLLAGPHSLLLVNRQHLRGRWLPDADERRPWLEVVDAISQRSVEAFPANTLGL